MANAKKCDRCGALYETRTENMFEFLVRNTNRTFKAKTYDSMVDLFEETFDLCPECSKNLKEWFKKGGKDPCDKEKVTKMSEPDSVDAWLREIWAVGADYDGCYSINSLKELIDELVAMSQKARACLREGKLFSENGKEQKCE